MITDTSPSEDRTREEIDETRKVLKGERMNQEKRDPEGK
jgi:hypothetical protein